MGARRQFARMKSEGRGGSRNGKGFDPASIRRGSGLDNLERRAATLGGSLVFAREDQRTVARLDVPLGRPDRSSP